MHISNLDGHPALIDTGTDRGPQAVPHAKPLLSIRPPNGWQSINVRELWLYRDLLLILASRDLKLRYRQTVLGLLWIFLGPLMSAGIFSFIFGKVAKLPSDGVPYFLFVFVGQMSWNVFTATMGRTQGSLVANAHLISKIYFPRLILPLSGIFSTLIDFGVVLLMALVLMAVNGVGIHLALLLLPLWLLLLMLAALGIGLIIAALSVTYRDAGQFIGPFVQFLMYASPVLYAMSVVPAKWRGVYYLNPMASLIEAFRWSLLRTSQPPWVYVAYAGVVCTGLFVGGAFVFQRMERRFADVI